ncbi:hypothetical protein SESBI_16609 [Sesbania bispinosa]|nr:hypothetical protein SESBI_16609 [Sesbania bispinosa]
MKEKKKDVATKKKSKQKVTTTPTYYQPVKPEQFIGFYVCKEFDGVRTLGTVDSYDHKNNMFKVEYDDCRIEYLEKNELVKNQATDKDIRKAQEALKKSNDSKKNGGGKKKNPTSGERSTPGGSTPTRNNNDSKKNDCGKRKISTSGDRSTESPTSKISKSEKNEYRQKTCRMKVSNQYGR